VRPDQVNNGDQNSRNKAENAYTIKQNI